jgi:hypothetical protein
MKTTERMEETRREQKKRTIYYVSKRLHNKVLIGDGKVGRAGKESAGVRQGGAALSIAHGKLDLVQTRLKCLILRGGCLQIELDAVLTRGEARVKFTVTKGLRLRRDDGDLELTSSCNMQLGKGTLAVSCREKEFG